MKEPLKKLTDEIRDKIRMYKRKQIDIKDLITGYDINNEDLSDSYISFLDMNERDISNCNLSNSKIQLQLQNGVARNCNFARTTFLQGSSFRGADIRNSNFNGCYAANIDFSYADIRDADACNATFTLFSKCFYKAKFSKKLLILMSKFLDIEGLKVD